MTKNKLLIRIIISSAIVILTVVALIMMFTNTTDTKLVANKWENFKFFTLDSNVLMCIAALIDLIYCVKAYRKGDPAIIPKGCDLFFYVGTAAVTLTLLTVMFFLGPLYGYAEMLKKSNLLFHLVNPLLAIAGLCLYHRERYIPWRGVFISILPMALYGIYYTSLILITGLDHPRTDWYYFVANGLKTAPLVLLIMFAAAFAISVLLRIACGGTKK
ncbi:MAG: hypothetical protein IJT91_08770 [Clostridia bacterium]|nr:hypothetical protein [Clostridia bacterium]